MFEFVTVFVSVDVFIELFVVAARTGIAASAKIVSGATTAANTCLFFMVL